MEGDKEIKEFVKGTYGELASEGSSCCLNYIDGVDLVKQAKHLGYSEEEIKGIPKEALMGLGCGNPLAFTDLKEGQRVVDLGSGAGLDSFLAAQKVGKTGKVIGVDMTREMVHKAQKVADQYGYKNIEFRLGEIEALPVEDKSIDLIISNCVINFTLNKLVAFQETYRVLKPGGKALIADMVAEGRLTKYERWAYEAWTGCKAGLIQKKEYLRTMREVGFKNIIILKEIPFQKLGLEDNSEGEIKSIQVEAYK